MAKNITSKRKKDHIDICLNDDVVYKERTNGFESYDFEHYAVTEVDFGKIDLSTRFIGKKISLPFMISCMTGGTIEAENINEKLASAANILNIPIGVGSQRAAFEDKKCYSSYRVVRKNAVNVPVLGNIGAAQIAKSKDPVGYTKSLIDFVEANVMVVHINPLQELLQPEGEPDFKGLLKNLDLICSRIKTPIVVKEVGSGISKKAAKVLLETGVRGIDVAGAGGTSWAAVELLRSAKSDPFLREWGLSTSYCVRSVNELRSRYDFTLIASGGIANGVDIAKSIALGADVAASARKILIELMKNDVEGVVNLINSWFDSVRKIMYLTGCDNLQKLKKTGLKRKEELI